jgi:aryl-alcohol dehydrogenase-like predicted oxidoreductase
MPRFNDPSYSKNLRLLPAFRQLARDAGITSAQLALRWVLEQAPLMHVIPGTTSTQHLADNVTVINIRVDERILERAGALINQATVSGPRYPPGTQKEIDTEQFEDEQTQPV